MRVTMISVGAALSLAACNSPPRTTPSVATYPVPVLAEFGLSKPEESSILCAFSVGWTRPDAAVDARVASYCATGSQSAYKLELRQALRATLGVAFRGCIEVDADNETPGEGWELTRSWANRNRAVPVPLLAVVDVFLAPLPAASHVRLRVYDTTVVPVAGRKLPQILLFEEAVEIEFTEVASERFLAGATRALTVAVGELLRSPRYEQHRKVTAVGRALDAGTAEGAWLFGLPTPRPTERQETASDYHARLEREVLFPGPTGTAAAAK
jgi:hypothetical protein